MMQLTKEKEDLESSRSPIIDRLKTDNLVLKQANTKLLEQCKYLESGIKDGQELLRARDAQLSRVELEKTKLEANSSARVKRLEADKSGNYLRY